MTVSFFFSPFFEIFLSINGLLLILFIHYGFSFLVVFFPIDLQSNFFIDNHSHMLSEDNENETTLRLLYYPPVIEEDDNKCEMAKGRCKYSQQHCNGNGLDLHLAPSKDLEHDNVDQTESKKKMENGVSKGADTEAEVEADADADADAYPETEANADAEDDDKSSNNEKKISEKNITRCGAHCDYGTFTLLSQDSEGGLEVKLPGTHKWARVGHLPGAILINTGEILSMWSQERYPALEHRVVIPQQENLRTRGRHSIAFFCHPGLFLFYLFCLFVFVFCF